MRIATQNRIENVLRPAILLAGAALCVLSPVWSQAPPTGTSPSPSADQSLKPLDSVVAVANNAIILASDLELEMRIFYLVPINDAADSTPPKALERLTTRALIEQQIVQQDPDGLVVTPAELEASLTELRQNLPACKHRDCMTPSGWAAYLKTLDLTPDRVATYWTHRIAVLRFIEERFRSGIRITPDEIQKYYSDNLVPRYAKPGDAPALERVSPRIQEILLQQRVNLLLNEWLKSLQDQGQVEILDASLKLPNQSDSAPAALSPGNGVDR
jgi:peptidyl-prolyl cis-trans isomerase SurA